jgi:hypothetical protein
MSSNSFYRPGEVRLIKLLCVLVVLGGLGTGPAQADQFTTNKNFVPAPNTPSYFVNESALFDGRDGDPSMVLQRDAAAVAAAPNSIESSFGRDRHSAVHSLTGSTGAEVVARRRAERSVTPGGNAQTGKEAEPGTLHRRAEAHKKVAQIAAPPKETAVNKQAKRDAQAPWKITTGQAIARPAALPIPAKPPAASPGRQASPRPPEPVAALPAMAAARPVASATPQHLAGVASPAPTRPLMARDGLPRTASDLDADSGRRRLRIRNDVARRSEMISPTVPE